MAKIRLLKAVTFHRVASVRLLAANARLKTARTAAKQTRLQILQQGARSVREGSATVAGPTERPRITQEGPGSARENAATTVELADMEEGKSLL